MDKRLVSSLTTAAFVASHGVEPQLQYHDGQVLFVFDKTPEVEHLLDGFEANAPCRILDYTRAFRRLRSAMYQMREREQAREGQR
jgi:hypothetical protein